MSPRLVIFMRPSQRVRSLPTRSDNQELGALVPSNVLNSSRHELSDTRSQTSDNGAGRSGGEPAEGVVGEQTDLCSAGRSGAAPRTSRSLAPAAPSRCRANWSSNASSTRCSSPPSYNQLENRIARALWAGCHRPSRPTAQGVGRVLRTRLRRNPSAAPCSQHHMDRPWRQSHRRDPPRSQRGAQLLPATTRHLADHMFQMKQRDVVVGDEDRLAALNDRFVTIRNVDHR